jgi:threonine dehydrogenase-like Zn-dependent dehydrogenase
MGFALAVAHAKAGHDVIIGSRHAARANEAAAKAKQQLQGLEGAGAVEGAELTAAAQKADVVFLVYGGFVNENKVSRQATSVCSRRNQCQALAFWWHQIVLQQALLPGSGLALKGARQQRVPQRCIPSSTQQSQHLQT